LKLVRIEKGSFKNNRLKRIQNYQTTLNEKKSYD
jgi:hypothetical protein